jgi:hypothetical protein
VTEPTSSHTCLNCGNSFTGKYCNQCGEKVYSDHDKSIVHLVEEGFHFVTHVEGSFFVTLKTVFFHPGKLSLDYCNGIRKKYFKPVSLFMLLVVLYLLFPKFSGLNMKLGTYATEIYGFTWVAIPIVQKKMAAKKVDFTTLADMYAKKSGAVAKLSLFLLIPLSALVTAFLFARSKRYYFDHLILCTEIISFYIALNFLLIPFISWIAESINKEWINFFYDGNQFLMILVTGATLLFLTTSFRRFFQQQWLLVALKAIVFWYVFGEILLYVYRLIVFLLTMLFV